MLIGPSGYSLSYPSPPTTTVTTSNDAREKRTEAGTLDASFMLPNQPQQGKNAQ